MTTRTQPVRGIVWQNGSAVFLARLVGWDAETLQQADVLGITYTVSLVDEEDRHAATAVAGHEDIVLDPTAVLFDALVTNDVRWDLDDTGYNFLHLLDTTAVEAFGLAGRRYLVTYRVTFAGQPPIMVVFQVDCRLA